MNILKGKSTRTKIFTVITVLIIVATIAFTLAFNYFVLNRAVLLDLTYEGFYTLTDTMKRECKFVDDLDEKVEIIFCNDPDRLVAQTVTRVVYYMSIMLDNAFENIETRTVNVALNPTALSQYKTTSLKEISPSDIIITYGDRYRVVNAEVFWYRDSQNALFSYNGEYKMASLLKSITAFSSVGKASAYFVTDHGETYYDESRPDENRELLNFIYALEDAGLKIKTLNLTTDEIPADCALLIINNPLTDYVPEAGKENDFYYVSPLEKIDRYLINNHGSLMVAKDFERELPLLEEFLFEWGFEFESALVKDSVNNIADVNDTNTQIVGSYNTDEDGYGMGIYSEYASMGSAPRFVLTNTGYIKCAYGVTDTSTENGTGRDFRIYSPLFFASDEASAYTKNENGEYLLKANDDERMMELVGVTTRKQLDSTTNENTYSYVMCANSAEFFTSAFVGSSAYSNYDILVALAQNATRADEHASIELGGISQNSPSYGGKLVITNGMTFTGEKIYDKDPSQPIKINRAISSAEIVLFTIIIFLIPSAIAVAGIYVKTKRKYL